MRLRHRFALGFAMSFAACAALVVDTPVAVACGCLSPPSVTEGEFAVNQRAEQIIFEVEPGWVTAHVLIKYAGDPAKFAWLIPVPEVPELAISPLSAFGFLDSLTEPAVQVTNENICPVSEYACARHDAVSCGNENSGIPFPDAGFASDAGASGRPPVTVISEQVVGDYQTVTFRASEAEAATQWLRSNGFVVNQTTSIYMESYVQANMVFVAAKLVPGAGASSIKPLRMKYRAAFPQVPLVLTAVAAEPHLTVTSFIYSQKPFKPQGHPVVTIDQGRIARDRSGRTNYPMLLARTIDEAGGDAFAIEYRAAGARPEFGGPSFCCGNSFDQCNVGNNQQCECPRDEFDRSDCLAAGDVIEGVQLLDDLATKYSSLTRITTRISAEEMTFDPAFEADFGTGLAGRLALTGSSPSLGGCASDVIDQTRFAEITKLQACAATYCGAGQCVITSSGAPACECNAGFVAQRFTDLDNLPSVTCVPQTPPCDLRAGGDELPDGCATASCGQGVCLDRNGVGVCACHAGAAAIAGTADIPRCEAVAIASQTPGAEDFSEPLRTLDVCAPAPPDCGDDGWLVKQPSPRPGVACGGPQPSAMDMIPKPKPTCGEFFGCGGCNQASDGAPIGVAVGAVWIFLALVMRRRRPTA
ncbi:MAG: DUF2330 domain-containing protein [Deltaproteobacteria bacterium]|nr:DUF2330 domain-containing protein [Deltaproteobacteria bacterium]